MFDEASLLSDAGLVAQGSFRIEDDCPKSGWVMLKYQTDEDIFALATAITIPKEKFHLALKEYLDTQPENGKPAA